MDISSTPTVLVFNAKSVVVPTVPQEYQSAVDVSLVFI